MNRIFSCDGRGRGGCSESCRDEGRDVIVGSGSSTMMVFVVKVIVLEVVVVVVMVGVVIMVKVLVYVAITNTIALQKFIYICMYIFL